MVTTGKKQELGAIPAKTAEPNANESDPTSVRMWVREARIFTDSQRKSLGPSINLSAEQKDRVISLAATAMRLPTIRERFAQRLRLHIAMWHAWDRYLSPYWLLDDQAVVKEAIRVAARHPVKGPLMLTALLRSLEECSAMPSK